MTDWPGLLHVAIALGLGNLDEVLDLTPAACLAMAAHPLARARLGAPPSR